MGANTQSRLDHGSWQTSLPTPALWVLRSMKRTRRIPISRKTPMDDKKHHLASIAAVPTSIALVAEVAKEDKPNIKESHAYRRDSR